MNNEEMLIKEFSKRILSVLGQEKVSSLSNRQDKILSKSYYRLLNEKPLDQITDAEILGSYEVIVDHVSPLAYEVFKRNRATN